MKIIQMINKYFSPEAREKRQKLRKIGDEITSTSNYNELVRLVKLYNQIENENKTN